MLTAGLQRFSEFCYGYAVVFHVEVNGSSPTKGALVNLLVVEMGCSQTETHGVQKGRLAGVILPTSPQQRAERGRKTWELTICLRGMIGFTFSVII